LKSSPHLLLAVSGHGYGHLAQCAPVINALWRRVPGLKVTVCSQLDRDVISGRLERPFDYRCVAIDPVLPMRNAWQVDVPAALSVYAAFHRQGKAGLARDRALLDALRPELVLADIPWRLLLAAHEAGVPVVALSSLNWAAVYRSYCGRAAGSGAVLEDMWRGYRAADVFLRPEPAMAMPELGNAQAIGPVARTGTADRDHLLAQLSLPSGTHTVLVALGGIRGELPLATWPRVPDTVWLLPQAMQSGRDDMPDCSRLPMAFTDMLASCDAVLTKPGYGTYTEAVCNGVPILTLARPDWPETAGMNDWARQHGRLQEISQAQFASGGFAAALQVLWQQPAVPPPAPTGIGEAAALLAARLPPG
jgi:hypothetical protein